VFGRPAALAEGSRKLAFTLRNAATGENTEVASVFLGPVR